MIPIGHVQVLPLLGGAQRSMLEILRFLDRDVFEPVVICQGTGELTRELDELGVEHVQVPELGREIHPWRDAVAFRKLAQLFRQRKFQLVHNQSAKPRVVGTLAARRAGVRVVVNHVRGYSFHEHTPRARRAVFEQVESLVARRSNVTLFVNNEDREFAVARRLAPSTASTTIYNGADLARFDPANDGAERHAFRKEYGIDDDEVAIVVMGRLEDQKQPLIFPRIAAELESRQLDRPWRIVVAGDGRLQRPLKEAVSTNRIWHRLQLIGWHASPQQVLAGSDIVLLPSLWEGLPRVLIEAHAAGLPCVASNIRGNREVVTETTGRLVSPCDASGYADALTPLVENPIERYRLGRAARQRAVEYFDSDRNSRAIIDLYGRLLNIPSSRQHRSAA